LQIQVYSAVRGESARAAADVGFARLADVRDGMSQRSRCAESVTATGRDCSDNQKGISGAARLSRLGRHPNVAAYARGMPRKGPAQWQEEQWTASPA